MYLVSRGATFHIWNLLAWHICEAGTIISPVKVPLSSYRAAI